MRSQRSQTFSRYYSCVSNRNSKNLWWFIPYLKEFHLKLSWIMQYIAYGSRNAVLRKVLHLVSTTVLTTNDLNMEFFVGLCQVSRIWHQHGPKFAWNAYLRISFEVIKSFRNLVWAAFCSVPYMCLYFWVIGFNNKDYWALVMQSLCLFPSSFSASSDEINV